MLDLLIIGAGIVGSWVALQAARRGLHVAVCDQTQRGTDGITGRNSGVIHAGLYYKPGSARARHCLRGRELLLDFVRTHQVAHAICGKLIVAGVDAEHADGPGSSAHRTQSEERLEALLANARANGVSGLELMREPGRHYAHVRGALALHSPGTGVVDVPAYHQAVRRAAEAAGALFLMSRQAVRVESGAVELRTLGPGQADQSEVVEARAIVNAAGLGADELARHCGLTEYEVRPNRGEYFRLRFALPYQKLVYPLPHTDSTALGVHYTFHTGGDAYAGPNSVWAAHKQDYSPTADRAAFFESLRRILDCYVETDLLPGYAGLRPRLFQNGQPVTDFVIASGPPGVLHLLGIESPGLTSAASLAEQVVERVLGK